MNEVQKTPAAKWRQEGQADPHGDHYNCQRAALTLGELTDDELANGVFLHGNEPLNINALLRKTPGYHSAVVWLTAGKDRIRWLSRALEESKAREQALQLRLNEADQRIDELTKHQNEPVNWAAPKTVRQLIQQLQTLDPELETHAMLRISDFKDGKQVRSCPLSISYERMEGPWLSSFKGDGRKVIAIWAKPDHRDPQDQGETLTESAES